MRDAAIAQQVERILGKDEVASSNLASSSKKSVVPFGAADFFVTQVSQLATSSVKISQFKFGERPDRCQWQNEGGERVAVVGEGRRHKAEDNRRVPQQDSSSKKSVVPFRAADIFVTQVS